MNLKSKEYNALRNLLTRYPTLTAAQASKALAIIRSRYMLAV